MNTRPLSRVRGSSSGTSISTKCSGITTTSSILRQHKNEFGKLYVDLCKMQHSTPLQVVTKGLDRGALDLIADRIKFDDWYPIVTAIETDQTLHRISIRLRPAVKEAIMDADTDMRARVSAKYPAITTKFVLFSLTESLRKILSTSQTLTTLELEGLPINGEFLHILAQGIVQTTTLKHLSLAKSSIQDIGAEILSLVLRNTPTILSIDLSHCDLTEQGAQSIARLISLQKLSRYSETWKETLRYRDPDVEAMPGLRRLTLNNNPNIGDRGAEFLVEELKDDLWLRALDLQNTGLTDEGALHLSQLIRSNPNLVILDPRANRDMSQEKQLEIVRYLAINNADKMDSEYKWLRIDRNASKPNNESKDSLKSTNQKKPFQSASAPSLPTKTLSSTNFGEVLRKENDHLIHQIKELNGILHVETVHKLELIRENHFLKQALEKSQEDKAYLEVMCKQSSISHETLQAIDETFRKLASLTSEGCEDPDLMQVLADMKRVLRDLRPSGIDLVLKPAGSLHDKVNVMKNGVILEDSESEKLTRTRDQRRVKNGERKRALKKTQKRGKQAETEAQKIFAKIIGRDDERTFSSISEGDDSS